MFNFCEKFFNRLVLQGGRRGETCVGVCELRERCPAVGGGVGHPVEVDVKGLQR